MFLDVYLFCVMYLCVFMTVTVYLGVLCVFIGLFNGVHLCRCDCVCVQLCVYVFVCVCVSLLYFVCVCVCWCMCMVVYVVVYVLMYWCRFVLVY